MGQFRLLCEQNVSERSQPNWDSVYILNDEFESLNASRDRRLARNQSLLPRGAPNGDVNTYSRADNYFSLSQRQWRRS
jgi:hypothetical protein